MRQKKRLFVSLFFTLLLVGGGIFYFTRPVEGVTRTWDCGGGDNSWNNDLNWSGDTEPGASDIASFDTTCTNNVTIDKSISLAGMNIAAGYTGTITQSSTFTITVGSSHWVQAAGTFTGGSGTIDVNGTFTLSGGTFTSTTGTLEVGYHVAGDITIFTFSSGTFNHNNGTVSFSTSSQYGQHTIAITGTLTLYNAVAAPVGTETNTTRLNLSSGGITVLNNFTHSLGRLAGSAWTVEGNFILGSGYGGTASINLTGSNSVTYTSTAGGTTAYLNINKSGGASVTPAGGTTNFSATKFTLTAGSFTAPTGTMTIGYSVLQELPAYGDDTIFTYTSGVFNHNNGTVSFSSSSNYGQHYISLSSPLTFHSVSTAIADGDGGGDATITLSGTATVSGNFTRGTNRLYGSGWIVHGNITIQSSAGGGTATITLSGPNNQTYTDNGGNEPDGDITINKTAGSVTLASNADWNASGQDLTITSGLLIVPSTYSLSTTALTIGASGTLHWSGTGDLTLAGNVSNAGTIKMRSTTCGQDDLVLIRSSSNGVQRTWSGAGTFQMYDVDVRDQAGSASITAYSSTNTANNGGNWTFSGAACPNIPPALGLPSGVINLGTGRVNLR